MFEITTRPRSEVKHVERVRGNGGSYLQLFLQKIIPLRLRHFLLHLIVLEGGCGVRFNRKLGNIRCQSKRSRKSLRLGAGATPNSCVGYRTNFTKAGIYPTLRSVSVSAYLLTDISLQFCELFLFHNQIEREREALFGIGCVKDFLKVFCFCRCNCCREVCKFHGI
jgi:hypothetical protein